MTWSVYADTLANDDRSVSALVPLLVLENDRELRGDHNRACGHVYPVPVVVRPPTTDGALGPLSVPVIVPRSPWLSDLRCTLTVETAESLDVTVWAAVEGGPFVRGETDTVDGVAVLEVTLPGVGAGDGWVVVRIGLTVDVEDPVKVTESGAVTPNEVIIDGGTMVGPGIVTTAGVEYIMPSGRTVYIGGQDGAGVWRVWPEVDDAELIFNEDSFGIGLPEVKVCAWRVDHIGAELIADESVQDGAPLSDSDIPRQVARVRRHWRARSIWAVAGPPQNPTTDHGARGTTVTMPAVVATTDQTARVRVAVLVGRGGAGEMRARLEWDGDETEYQDLPARRGPASLIVRDGASGWTGRDLLFTPDLASYALLELDVETAPASTYIVAEDAVVRASGVSAVHVAALSIVEVPE